MSAAGNDLSDTATASEVSRVVGLREMPGAVSGDVAWTAVWRGSTNMHCCGEGRDHNEFDEM